MELLAIVTMVPPPPLAAIVIIVVSRCRGGGGGGLDLFIVAHNYFVMYPIERTRTKVMMVMACHPSA
jgi:hypothetical protein